MSRTSSVSPHGGHRRAVGGGRDCCHSHAIRFLFLPRLRDARNAKLVSRCWMKRAHRSEGPVATVVAWTYRPVDFPWSGERDPFWSFVSRSHQCAVPLPYCAETIALNPCRQALPRTRLAGASPARLTEITRRMITADVRSNDPCQRHISSMSRAAKIVVEKIHRRVATAGAAGGVPATCSNSEPLSADSRASGDCRRHSSRRTRASHSMATTRASANCSSFHR